MARRLYIGNLSYNTDEQGLRDAFSKQGEIKDVKIVMDRETGRSRGFAFVEFTTDAAAAQAITAWNGVNLDGRALTVNEAKEREAGGGRGGGGGGSYSGSGGGGYGGGGGGGDRGGRGGGGGGRGGDRDGGRRRDR